MKVRDIIINEGAILDILKYPFVKFLGPLARASLAERQAIERLAAQWALEIEQNGKITTKASSIIGKDLAKDPKVVAEIEKQAQNAAKEAAYAKNAQAFNQMFGETTSAAIKWGMRFGYAEPMTALGYHIYDLQTRLSKGQITPEQYNKELQFYLGKCTTQMATIVAAGGALKLGTAFLKTVDLLPFGEKIVDLVKTLSPAAKASFAVWLGTPGQYGGMEFFHKWYIGESFWKDAAKWSRDVFGSLSKNAWDIIANKAHEISGGIIPDSPGNPRSNPNHPDNPANQKEVDILPQGTPQGWDTRQYDSTTGQFR